METAESGVPSPLEIAVRLLMTERLVRTVKRIILATIMLVPACSSEQASSTRGKFAVNKILNGDGKDEEAVASSPSSDNASTTDSTLDGSAEPVLSADDLYLYFADDRKGAIDTALADISSDELRVAVVEDLGDNGFVEKLLPTYLAVADSDKNGDLNFSEFLNAGIEKDGQEDVVRGIIEGSKQTVFSYIDFDHNNVLGNDDLLRLVRVRVWRLRNWASEVGAADPSRLKLLAKTGYTDLYALVAKTYNSGPLSDENFQKLTTAISAKLK
jgi:hypothetical protein